MNVFELEGSISLDVNGFKKAVSDAKKQGQDLGKSFTDQSAAILDLQKEIERLSNDLTATKSEISRLKSELDKAAKAADSNADSTSKMAKEAENASDAIDDEVKATEKSSNVNDALKDILEKVAKSLDNMADVMSDVGKEEDNTAKKTDDYKDSARKAKDETNLFEKAARALGEAAKDTASKVGDLASKVGDMLVGAAKLGVGAITAASGAIAALTKSSVSSYGEYEQLVGGAQKIFDQMDYSKIAEDAANAYKDLNMSASEYLESINLAGATFAQTMGDEKGYNTARKGMLAISDYASGTGKSITELNTKYQMITRAASSYQSIADQFSGILPATSADFLAQAQAAGYLSKEYEKLTEVPVAEYQQAVTDMLVKGVDDLGLSMNTAREATETLTGSMAMTKAAWKNLVTGFSDPNADIGELFKRFSESAKASFSNILPTVEQAISGIGEFIELAAPEISAALPGIIESVLPSLLSAGSSLVKSLVGAIGNSIPVLAPMGANLVKGLATAISMNAPKAITAFAEMLRMGVDWLTNNLDEIISMGAEIVGAIIQGIDDNKDSIWSSLSDLGSLLWDKAIVPTWNWITQKLPEHINNLVSKADFSKISSTISDLIIGGLNGIADFIGNVDWDEIGVKISEFLNGIDWKGILTALFEVIKAVIKAAPELLEGVIRSLDFDSAAALLAMIFVPKMLSSIASSILAPGAVTGISTAFTTALSPVAAAVGLAFGAILLGKISESLKGIKLDTNEFGVTSLRHEGSALSSAEQNKAYRNLNSGYDTNKSEANWGSVSGQEEWEKKWGKSTNSGVTSKVTSKINLFNDMVNGGTNSAGYFNSANDMNTIRKGFATGFYANRPTVLNDTLVGESGDEVLLPLDTNTSWMDKLTDKINGRGAMFGALNVTVNVSESIDNIDDIGVVIVRKIDEAMQSLSIDQARSIGGTGWQ